MVVEAMLVHLQHLARRKRSGASRKCNGNGCVVLNDFGRRIAQIFKLARRVAKLAGKTHKDRVNEFNSHLESLSEHHDIPKVCIVFPRVLCLLRDYALRLDQDKAFCCYPVYVRRTAAQWPVRHITSLPSIALFSTCSCRVMVSRCVLCVDVIKQELLVTSCGNTINYNCTFYSNHHRVDTMASRRAEPRPHICPPSSATHPSGRWESLFVYSFICKFTSLRGKLEGLESPMECVRVAGLYSRCSWNFCFHLNSLEHSLLTTEANPVLMQVLKTFILNLKPQTRNLG